jgi:hypothetical protein
MKRATTSHRGHQRGQGELAGRHLVDAVEQRARLQAGQEEQPAFQR